MVSPNFHVWRGSYVPASWTGTRLSSFVCTNSQRKSGSVVVATDMAWPMSLATRLWRKTRAGDTTISPR